MKSIFVFSLLFFSSLTVSAQTYRELSEKAIDCIERDSLAQAEDLLVQAMKLEPVFQSRIGAASVRTL